MTAEKTTSEDGNERRHDATNPNRVSFEEGGDFVSTGEHRHFVEFCEDRRRYRDIGVYVGIPGIGKTVSAKR